MNNSNLKPFAERTEEEQRAIRVKGGKASGESRRRRKTLKEELLLLLESNNVQQSVATALINEAIEGNNAGSVARAFEVIRDTVGEKPVDKVMIAEIDPSVIDEVEKAVLDDKE